MNKNGKNDGKQPRPAKQTVVDTAADVTAENARLRRNDFIAKVLCILGAIVIWFYIMDADSPDYEQLIADVPVTLTGVATLENQRQLSVYGGYDLSVDVTVNGKKSVINKITADDIKVTAEVSGIEEAGSHSVALEAELPDTLSLVSLSQQSVEVYTDTKGSVTLDISVKISSAIVDNGNVMGEPVPEASTVSVTGPQTALDRLETALVTLDIGRVASTVNAIGRIALYDENSEQVTNPYLRLSRSEVGVTVPVYKNKTLPLTVAFRYGYFNSSNSVVSISPATVEVRGDPELIDSLSSLTIATLDEKSITEDESRLITLDPPDGISIVGAVEKATVDIAHKNTVTRRFVVNDIAVTGAAGLAYRLHGDKITVTLRGSSTDLKGISAGDIAAVIDLSGYTPETSGTVTETVDITIDTEANVYEIGYYSIELTLGEG